MWNVPQPFSLQPPLLLACSISGGFGVIPFPFPRSQIFVFRRF